MQFTGEKKKEIEIMKAEVPWNEYTIDTNLDYFIRLPTYWIICFTLSE